MNQSKKLRPLSSSLSKLQSIAAVFSALTMATAVTQAKDYQWDSDASSANGVTGGGGTWNTITTNWFDGTNLVVWPNTVANSDRAIFSGTGGIVNLGNSILVNALQFDSTGYSISNNGTSTNTLTLAGTAPSISVTNSGDTATISATLIGGVPLLKTGAGTLILNGSNTFSGVLGIGQGTLVAGSSTALGTTTGGTTIASGATLNINGQNLGAEAISVQGTGVGDLGAIVNTGGPGQLNALTNVTLKGNTTFGGTSRWDIRSNGSAATLSTGGSAYTLTKVGTNQINLAGVTVDDTLADIRVNGGILGFETTTSLGDPTGTLTVSEGATVQFLNTSTTGNVLDKNLVLNGGTGATGATVQQAGGTTVFAGPVTINGTRNTINVAGSELDLYGRLSGTSALTKTGTGLLVISNFSNDFIGAVTVQAGTIRFDSKFSLGSTPSITVAANAAAAAGYPIDQVFVQFVAPSSAGSIALGADSANFLDFSGGYTSTSLGASGNYSFTGILNPNGTTYRLGGGGGTLTLPNPNTLTGARSLFVTNGSTVVLANSNDLTGAVTVNSGTLAVAATGGAGTGAVTISAAGTLQIGNGGTTGVLTNSSITGTGTLSFKRSDSYTFSQAVGGTLTLNQASTSTLNLTPSTISRLSLTAPGRINLTSSTVTLGADTGNLIQMLAPETGTVGSSTGGSIRLNVNGGDIGAVAGGTLIVNMPITNGGGSAVDIFNPTAGTVVFGAANTYTGVTNILGGTLVAASLNRVSGGTASSSLGAPTTVANGTINIGGSAPSTLRYVGAGESTDRVINLSGTTNGATLEQSGTGTLTFTSDFTATGAGSKTLTLQGSTAGIGAISGKIVDNNSTNKTSLVKTGTGTWSLSGANTYTGSTGINGGTLRLDFATATAASDIISASSALELRGGRLAVTGKAGATNSQTFAGTLLDVGGSALAITNDPSSNSVAVNLGAITRNAGATVGFSGPTTGTNGPTNGFTTSSSNNATGILGGYATVNGTDWATVSGTNIVAYTGYTATPATGGSASTNAAHSGSKSITGATTLNSLKISDTAAAQSMTLGTNTLNLGGTNGSGGLLYAGGTSNSYTISGGTIAAGANELIIHTGGTVAPTLTVSSVISGSGGLTKAGPGQLTLSGTNTFSGDINVNGGTLAINGPGGVADSAALGSVGSRQINLNGGTFKLNTSSYNPPPNSKAFTIAEAGGTFEVATGATLTLDDGNSNAGAGASFAPPQLQGSGVLTKTGTGTLQLGGSTQLDQVEGGNGFAGFTGHIVVAAGTLQVGNSKALGSTVGNTTVQSGATLDFYSAPAVLSEAFTIAGTGVSNNGALINSSANPATLNGPVALAGATSVGGNGSGGIAFNNTISNSSASSSLTKIGTGVVVLNGANNFAAGTAVNVNAGTLTIGPSGSISGVTNVAVATGATLNVSAFASSGGYSIINGQTVSGKGTVTGDLSVAGSLNLAGTVNGAVSATSGTISPGDPSVAGTLAVKGNLLLGSSAKLWLDLGTTLANGSDLLTISAGNTATLGGSTLQLATLPTFNGKIGDIFTLILNGGSNAVSGVFGNATVVNATTGTVTLANGVKFEINYAANLDAGAIGNDVTAKIVTIPEPSTFMALIGGMGALVGLTRRRSRQR